MERLKITNDYDEYDIWNLFDEHDIVAELDGYDRFIISGMQVGEACDVLEENGYDVEIM